MTECCCSYDYDYEVVKCQSETIRTARTTHICCECSEVIEPGQKYELRTYLFDDRWSKDKTCIPCSLIASDIGCGRVPFGGLREAIADCLGFDYVTGEDVCDEEIDPLDPENLIPTTPRPQMYWPKWFAFSGERS